MIFIPFSIEKCIYLPARLVPPPSHLTYCTPTKSNLYFDIFSPYFPERTCPIHASDIPCIKSHVHFMLRSFIQGIRPGPRLLVHFRNRLIFYGEELLAPRPTPKLEDQPLSAVRDCLYSIFAAAFHNWRASTPFSTWGRVMPWWQGTNLTWIDIIYRERLKQIRHSDTSLLLEHVRTDKYEEKLTPLFIFYSSFSKGTWSGLCGEFRILQGAPCSSFRVSLNS
jgi:hypothetical protein